MNAIKLEAVQLTSSPG